MKIPVLLLLVFCAVLLFVPDAAAQCSICTKTAAQLGEKSAKGLNAGILYLAAAPLTVAGIIGYNWWRKNGAS